VRVFLAGASGVVGRPLVRRLVRSGHEVIGTTRSTSKAEVLEALGARVLLLDARDRGALRTAVEGSSPEVVINQLTSIPKRLNPRRVEEQMAATNALRRDVTPVLVEAARAAGARRVIHQSISFVYDTRSRAPAAESEPLYLGAPRAFAGLVDAIHVSERAVLEASDVEGVVLRYGYLYGPGTSYVRDGTFAEDVRRRRVPIVGDGGGVSSFVHVDDAAEATVLAMEQGEPGPYNIVDDEPAAIREWLPAYAGLLGAPRPLRLPKLVGRLGAGPYGVYFMTQQRGASNRKARRLLGWSPRNATWRTGFAAMLAEAGEGGS
jgi:nucleoside-diphosphate-sugar epimerase